MIANASPTHLLIRALTLNRSGPWMASDPMDDANRPDALKGLSDCKICLFLGSRSPDPSCYPDSEIKRAQNPRMCPDNRRRDSPSLDWQCTILRPFAHRPIIERKVV